MFHHFIKNIGEKEKIVMNWGEVKLVKENAVIDARDEVVDDELINISSLLIVAYEAYDGFQSETWSLGAVLNSAPSHTYPHQG